MTAPAPPAQAPGGLGRPNIPAAAPAVPPANPPAAPPGPTPIAGPTPIEPPGGITVPVSQAPTPTLEEQAAALQAQETAQLTPQVGADVMLPEGLSDDLKGKSVADLYSMLKETKGALTQAQQAIAAGTPAAPGQPPAVPPSAPAPGAPDQPPQVQVPPGPADPHAGFNAALEAYAKAYQDQGNQLTDEQVAAFAKTRASPKRSSRATSRTR